ncbi:hypothetical protein DFH29DRAFT_877905 [Suillus ampliporus]|nr:hypothetical protein DFH29DRAFT_877905 [Suillus ampliporus]
MQSFIGRFPVSVSFDAMLLNSVVSVGIGFAFGCLAVGTTFTAVLITTYEGWPLTTDVLFKVAVVLHDDVVVGSDWLAAWRQVGHFDHQVAWHSSPLSEVGAIESSSEAGTVLGSRAHSESILCDVFLGSRISGRVIARQANINVDDIACQHIHSGFPLAHEITAYFIDQVLTAPHDVMMVDNLYVVVDATDLEEARTSSSPCHSRHKLVNLIMLYRDKALHARTSNTVLTLLTSSDHLTREGNCDVLLDRILDHVTKENASGTCKDVVAEHCDSSGKQFVSGLCPAVPHQLALHLMLRGIQWGKVMSITKWTDILEVAFDI